MRKLLLSLLLSACFIGNAYSAELLVRAAPHWMDSLTSEEVAKMSEGEKQSYEARSQKGDVIVVRPDGWNWGKDERDTKLFTIIKAPGMTEAEAKKYEETLTDTKDPQKPVLLRVRKFSIPSTLTAGAVSGAVTTTKATLQSQVITKIGASSEVIQPKSDLLKTGWRNIKPYLDTAYRFYAENAYAATQLLKTVKPSGGDYTSLEACMNANEQNLVTADKYFDVEIDGTWSSADTSAVTIHNYTTDATRYINIYTTTAARHTGKLGGCYTLDLTVTAVNIQGNSDTNKITIMGLCIDLTDCSTNAQFGFSVASYKSNITLAYNLIKMPNQYGCAGIIGGATRGQPWYIYNNIIYSVGNNSDYLSGLELGSGNDSDMYIYNNTIYGFKTGIRIDSVDQQIIINNLVMNAGTTCIATPASGSNNATSDGTGDDSPLTAGVVSKTSYADYFVDITIDGGEDFHLKSTATDFINAGADLSATFTDDIDGVTRTGTWDIGADEYVAAGGGTGVIKSIWGINWSDIKKINGIDVGDIKSINGLPAQ